MGITYKDSGVDIEKGNSFVKKISPIVKATFSKRVITDIGGFGALFSGSFPEYKDPVLVSGTDGVGTKLRIAQMMNIHDTIGIDAVAMCVNDIVTTGAKPLFFLDYLFCGRLDESVHVDVIKGVAEGCRISDCSLIGGETAEHPNIVAPEDYDVAGFAVGVVDRENIINGERIKKGDSIIGLPSSGIHSNGFSLVRRLFLELKKYDLNKRIPELPDTLGKTLLIPTRIYTGSIMKCIDSGIDIKGIVHITGGGFYENIPRMLPKNAAAHIISSSFRIPSIFRVIQKEGEIDDREMYTTFNMGIGMVLFVDKNNENTILDIFNDSDYQAAVIGEVVEYDNEKVIID